MIERDLFISHSSGDAEVARELRVLLEDAGYTCWMAPDDVTGTDPWAEQILTAIRTSRAMLVLVSSHSNGSPHVAREVGLATGRDRAVLPIRLEAVSPEGALEYHLAGLQRMDAFPPPIANHTDRILRRLRLILPRDGDASTSASTPGATTVAKASADPAEPAAADALAIADLPTEPLAPPSAPELDVPGIGSRIGGFTIESVLGEGGMATVYRATQDEPRRAVALKLIRADHAADETYHQRFLAEKDTLAALEHPSIVPIYAAGEASDRLYIAMRLIDGPDLAARLAKGGRLSLDETVDVLRPIADAIDYAHEMGVVHRDLKPSNILLDRRGRAYLTDFGLGKTVDHPRDLSAPGIAVGTLAYMAPEQFSGVVDPSLAGRIDVYALGCVAYACLTGQPPFRADEPERVMYGHLEGEIPSLKTARPDLPAAVDTAVRRALAKDPRERYATASELLSTLAVAADVSDDRTAPIPIPARPRPGGFGAWARANSMLAGSAATLAALVIIAAGVLAIGQPTASQSPGTDGSKGGVATSGPSPEPSLPTVPPSQPPTDPPPTEQPTDPPPSGPSPSPEVRPPTRPPTEPPTDPKDLTPPTGGIVRINKNAVYTTSGSVTVRVTTKPVDAQSGIRRYVWSRSNQRPTSGAKAYDGTFTASIPTATRATHTIYVWFQNGDGVWTTSPVKDSIIFDHKPFRDSDCPSAVPVNAAGIDSKYIVWIKTSCFSDSDGDALTIYASQPGTGSIGAATSADCGANQTCWWYYPPSGWGGGSFATSFSIWAEDDLGASSGTIRFDLCVNC